MKYLQIKNFYIYILIISFLIKIIQNQGNPNDQGNPNEQGKLNDPEKERTIDHQNIAISVLIVFNVLFSLTIISIFIYEFIKRRNRKRRENLINNFNNKRNINLREINQPLNNISNSFHSSKMSSSLRGQEGKEFIIDSNNSIKKVNLKESDISIRERSNSGYEAPVAFPNKHLNNKDEELFLSNGNEKKLDKPIENLDEKFTNGKNESLNNFTNDGNKSQNYFTNDGNDNQKNINSEYMDNPFNN